MATIEEVESAVRDSGTLVQRLGYCMDRISRMCEEGRPPRMSVPVRWDDDDMFISVTLKDAMKEFDHD